MNAVIHRIKASLILSMGLTGFLLMLFSLSDRPFLMKTGMFGFLFLAVIGSYVFSLCLAGFITHIKISLSPE